MPAALQALSQSVLAEAVRDARKHADPRRLAGGLVEFGERVPATWQVRLVVPLTSDGGR